MKLKFLQTVQYRDPKFTRNENSKGPFPPLDTYVAGQVYDFDGNKHRSLINEVTKKGYAEKHTEPEPVKVDPKANNNDDDGTDNTGDSED